MNEISLDWLEGLESGEQFAGGKLVINDEEIELPLRGSSMRYEDLNENLEVTD
jgi:hypothetical protein